MASSVVALSAPAHGAVLCRSPPNASAASGVLRGYPPTESPAREHAVGFLGEAAQASTAPGALGTHVVYFSVALNGQDFVGGAEGEGVRYSGRDRIKLQGERGGVA